MEALNVDQFIENGYLLLRRSELADYSSRERIEDFLSDIRGVRSKMKRFFERPPREKALFEMSHDRDPETGCYRSGWWGRSSYDDPRAGVDYPLEYYVSKNYYSATEEEICHPSNEGEEIRRIPASLPGRQTFSFGKFMDEHFVTPLLRGYSLACGLEPPSPSMQIQTTYYEEDSSLAVHRDRSFLEGIVGPATGLTIWPNGGTEKMEAALGVGDVILYTGYQFQKYYATRASKVPAPLPHAVEAHAGRMSILFGCWMPDFK